MNNTAPVLSLQTLYPPRVDYPESYLVVSWPEKIAAGAFRSRWFPCGHWAQAVDFITQQTQGRDVYFGVNLRHPDARSANAQERYTQRGGNADIVVVPGMYIDLDGAWGQHKRQAPLPHALAELVDFLQTLPAPPSLIVNSGGGVHAYHLFTTPCVIHNETDRHALDTLLKRYQYTLRTWATERHGWDFESTHDLARVLRLPGTTNHKYGKPVEVLHDTGQRFPLDAFSWLLDLPEHGDCATEGGTGAGTLDLRTLAHHYGVTLKKKSATELCGAHPLHGSDTGTNLNINAETQQWHCWRHLTGGDALYFIAVCEGILSCEYATKGAFKQNKAAFIATVELANRTFNAGIVLHAHQDAAHRQNGTNALNALNAYSEQEITVALPSWPALHPAALYGLPGDIVRLIEPHTEADPVAILGQLLGAFSVAIGHKPYFYVDGTDHYMNLFLTLVGQTAKGRKGTSANYVKRLFHWPVDQNAEDHIQAILLNIMHGLSSGEGLIWQVRDPIRKREPVKVQGRVVDYQDVLVDQGVDDKRLLVMEAEFSRVLQVMARETNTLSATIREAWDTGDLRTMTKNTPAIASGAHIGIIGHITAEELQRCLTETEAANGFGNRFLWLCVKRSKLLPEGGNISQVDFFDAKQRLRKALHFVREVEKLTRSASARELWHDAYPLLTAERPGLLGSIIGRAEAQVLRLSCIYALLDMSAIVERPHLEAALALWQYAEDSAIYLFGDSLGDPLADDILRMLRLSKEGMSRTELFNAFNRNRKSGEIGAALERLRGRHLARMESARTEDAKRPTEVWYATNKKLHESTHLTHLTHLIGETSPVEWETGTI